MTHCKTEVMKNFPWPQSILIVYKSIYILFPFHPNYTRLYLQYHSMRSGLVGTKLSPLNEESPPFIG